jgi:Holliday junction resolvase RusA-like endonuclease
MTTIISALEYRLIVPGKAESFRSKRAMDFRSKIAQVALRIIDKPLEGEVEIFVDYFHVEKRKMDMDNISKNVLDALTGIAYTDDVQVRNQNSRAHYLGQIITLADLPIDSIKPMKDFSEYTFIRIRETKK